MNRDNIVIPFNKPYITGDEIEFIKDTFNEGYLSGNGKYTKLCQSWFENKYNFQKCLLTTSCTDALEMISILLDINFNDEVIAPSYTFVSTVNSFVLHGAKIKFVDSRKDHPGMDEDAIESLITEKTKAIIVVHYAGIACDMDKIIKIAKKYNLFVIEDAAQAIDSFYIDQKGVKKPLGSIGHFAAFSFHETKNIISGEGGMLVINDSKFNERSEIIWEKGTNRVSFYKGEVNKYGWVDIGSSFLPSEIISSFLWAQLQKIDFIQNERISKWNKYFLKLNNSHLEKWISLPSIPKYSSNNCHIFYIVLKDKFQRESLMKFLKINNINTTFHYQCLNDSDFYKKIIYPESSKTLDNSIRYSDSLLRLPLYIDLQDDVVYRICDLIIDFFKKI